MKNLINSVKGTRDFYPREMTIRKWLYAQIGEISKSFGYQEYEAPLIERIDLYAAKSGEELVKQQAFVFNDKGGDLVTLRPELTPSLARMVAARQNELVYPLRWWSFGPFWRYEKPQKGRTREFFQWNIDMIGVNSPESDAELIAICASFLIKAGLSPDQVQIMINHRKLMEDQLVQIGIGSELIKDVFRLIDRVDKLSHQEWVAMGREVGLSETHLAGLNTLLENRDLWKESQELVRIIDVLNSLGVSEYVKFDPRIIRGLDYYTGTVFEAWDVGGDGRAILGGGHYDNLVGDVGGETLPGVGFAMGDVMITILLEKYGLLPQGHDMGKVVFVSVFDPEHYQASAAISARLRSEGFDVICYPEAAKLQKQLKFADRMGIKIVILAGPDEMAAGTLAIKNLQDHTQVKVPVEMAGSVINSMLAGEQGL